MTNFKVLVMQAKPEGEEPGTITFTAGFESADNALAFARKLAVEAWGEEGANAATYTTEQLELPK